MVLTGPSGSGKTTLKEALVDSESCMAAITATTRQKRPGEFDGIHYHFFTKKQFEILIAKGELIEHVKIDGDYYGLPHNSLVYYSTKPYVIVLNKEGAVALTNIRKDVFLVHLNIDNHHICPKRKERDKNTNWDDFIPDLMIDSFEDIDIPRIMCHYYGKFN